LFLSEVRELDQQQFACLAVSRWKSILGRICGLAVSVIAILAAAYNSDVRSALIDKSTIGGAAGDRRAAHASSNASVPRSEAGAIVSDEYVALLSEVPAEHAQNEAAAPPKKLDAKTAAALTTRAKNLLALGDIAAARSLLERVANAHDATAAFLLAQTYDPTVLGVTDSRSITPDPVRARDWYRKAASFGSANAQRRLAQISELICIGSSGGYYATLL